MLSWKTAGCRQSEGCSRSVSTVMQRSHADRQHPLASSLLVFHPPESNHDDTSGYLSDSIAGFGAARQSSTSHPDDGAFSDAGASLRQPQGLSPR
eukprot:1350209-Rhodomonas_salina.2